MVCFRVGCYSYCSKQQRLSLDAFVKLGQAAAGAGGKPGSEKLGWQDRPGGVSRTRKHGWMCPLATSEVGVRESVGTVQVVLQKKKGESHKEVRMLVCESCHGLVGCHSQRSCRFCQMLLEECERHRSVSAGRSAGWVNSFRSQNDFSLNSSQFFLVSLVLCACRRSLLFCTGRILQLKST